MIWNRKPQPIPTRASPPKPDKVLNLAEMAARVGLTPVPAAWPTGVSQLARAIDACQRCDTGVICADWLRRAPSTVALPPEFCPNAERLELAKRGG